MSYILQAPMLITSRLLPGVRVGGVYISIEPMKRDGEGRVVCRYTFDFPLVEGRKRSRTFKGEDLRSGCGQAYDPRRMLESLLAFVEHAAETSEENKGFTPFVVEWAQANADEIGLMRMDLEENRDCCVAC